MKHRLWIIAGAAVGAVLIAVGALAAVRLVNPAALAKAKEYDIIGMLREIHQANSATQEVNGQILDSLKNVEQAAARVKNVDAKMTALESGVAAQQAALARLKAITAEQARLSRALQELTAQAGVSAGGVAETARAEALDLSSMRQVTATMAARLKAIGGVNSDIADKLDEAATISATILDDMP